MEGNPDLKAKELQSLLSRLNDMKVAELKVELERRDIRVNSKQKRRNWSHDYGKC